MQTDNKSDLPDGAKDPAARMPRASGMPQPLLLFLCFLRIGAFTFGGYAMIALIRAEFVDKRHFITEEEFIDMVAVAESTPGPIAINAATYIGYRVGGVVSAATATLGVCIPSFIIIYVISLFFDAFLTLSWAAWAFRGIQASVAYLILAAGVKMARGLKRTPMNVILMGVTCVALLLFTLFSLHVSSLVFILLGAAVGVTVYLIRLWRERGAEK